ncbi:hypothetical protein [Quadrisphaera sp. DSM 44207]|uniref:hypothetical protein n=1 Tax=Quadrisphaera sp. DSM 44207 TaxID=1881057 RepID=UPI000891E4A9|nr:hypothetical protein [Quadrisphaera sp. DSM 44207]SDQ06193.1 hypothetical protein SAMN05428996_0283 [Quadrisphaera sp. DSM 44207]
MVLGVLLGLAAAVAFGVAALLQALAARREATARRVDPRLLLRLLRHPAFLAALALNLAGFGLHLAALRTLPLFLAQTAVAASVVVTALLSTRVLGHRLAASELLAVLGVCGGLVLLTATAAETGTVQADAGLRAALLVAVAAVGAGGVLAGRLRGAGGASLLGLVAGLGFAVVAVAGRVLPDLHPAALVADPVTWALVAGGAVAFLLYSTALQRGSVLTATSTMVLAQTVAPAAVGVLLLGDQTRAGTAPLALAGLVLAATGAAALARFDPAVIAAARRSPDEAPDEAADRDADRVPD